MRRLTGQPSDMPISYRDPFWTPDGLSIWTSLEVPKYDEEGNWVGISSHIRRIVIATSEAEIVVESAYSPAVSPDGQQLAYLMTDPETYRTGLWLSSVDGEGARAILDSSVFYYILAPQFSPDGTMLAFAAIGEPAISQHPARSKFQLAGARLRSLLEPLPAYAHGLPPADIWLINVDGSGLTRLTTLYEDNPTPNWSADGQYIAFGGAKGVYLVEVQSQDVVRISDLVIDGEMDWIQ